MSKSFLRIDVGSLGTVGAVLYETQDGYTCKVSLSNGNGDDISTPDAVIGLMGHGETAAEATKVLKNQILRALYN